MPTVPKRDTIDHDAPLPLGVHRAVDRALELRERSRMSYRAISIVMDEYHGVRKSKAWWVKALHARGATIVRPDLLDASRRPS